MSVLFFFEAVCFLASAICCYLAASRCVLLIPKKNIVARFLLAATFIVIFFSLLFFGIIIGGSFGGAIMSHLMRGGNYEKISIILGIGVGIFLVTTTPYVMLSLVIKLLLKWINSKAACAAK